MNGEQTAFMTIRATAKNTGISEYYLRRLVAQGQCPGFYSGNRFYINVPQLKQQLDKESAANLKADTLERT